MKIIYNKYFPFGPFWATNVLGIIFCRIDKGRLTEVAKNHEYIHTLQQKEMGYIGFLIWYHIEWLIKWVKYRDKMKAYRNLLFEREAYQMQYILDYRNQRKHYAWWYLYAQPGTLLHDVGCFLGDIKSFIKEDFLWSKYLFAFLMAVSLIIAQVHFNFYDVVMGPSYDNGTSMLVVPSVYITIYFFVLIATLFFHKELWRLRQWQVWVFPLLLIFAEGAGQGFNAYKEWINESTLFFNEKKYLSLVGSFLFRSVGTITVLCLFRWATTGRFGLYGLTRSTKYLKVYATIYMILVPIFVLVSLTPQFLSFYPKMNINYCHGSFGWADWKLISLFELSYANDFLAVESMFRGALIIGLGRWLGPRAILPMALTYMSIHFGKPDLEMCSSVLGGYLLGILAYRTHHLWGGITIHLGIAMLFEALGLWMGGPL